MTKAGPIGRFSTAMFPVADRLDMWRELFGRGIVKLEMAQLDDEPLRYDARFRQVGGVSVADGTVSAITCKRGSREISDSNDDLVVVVPLDGQMRVEQAGHEVIVAPGQALVRRSDEPGQTWSQSGRYLTLGVAEALVTPRLADADRLVMTVLPGGTEAMRLIAGYAGLLLDHPTGIGPPPDDSAALHLADLLTLALGADRDNWQLARGRGLKAARQRAIAARIAARALDPGFGINGLAADLGISPSYVRRLLAESGHSFADAVMDRRLSAAHDLLRDPRQATRRISDIAYGVGFNDISYFNRAFRARYGAPPGAVRAGEA